MNLARRRDSAADSPKIAFCMADVGCGHGRAATAIMLAMRDGRPDLRPQLIDALACAPRWFNHLYRDAYLAAARHLPTFNGWLYRRTDVSGIPPYRGVASLLETMAMKAFCNSDAIRNADLIVCTHFLCARVLSAMRQQGELKAKFAVGITDQHPHAVWRVPHADLYMVASDAAADEMIRNGVDRERIIVTGIPIDGRFEHAIAQADARRWHQLPLDRPIALICGGGLGLGGLDAALMGMLLESGNHFAIVICGHNEKLFERLTAMVEKERLHDRCRIIGVTSKMHELMSAADVLVGKPGGLTTAEALARQLPMVLLRPIPGQEERNADVLVNARVAVRHDDPFIAGQSAARLLSQHETLAEMRHRAAALGRPAAAAIAAEA
ncbi:MAG: glycosyltransferase, partial [Phycisphaerae bacterium]|nr:glycosyltransferase [Phycisphaerae bacterium]